jgi:predicted DNA-binding protein
LKDAGLPHRFSAGDSFALTGPSWQAATPGERSHDSRTYTERFMLRLDEPSQTKLQQLVKQFGASKAQIIRQLINHAEPEDFPASWQMRAAERHVPRVP